MDVEEFRLQYQEKFPKVENLSSGQVERIIKIIGGVEETVGLGHLIDCIADNTSSAGDGSNSLVCRV